MMSDKIKIAAMMVGFATLTALAFLGLGMMMGYQRGASSCKEAVVEHDTVTVRDTVVYNIFHTDTVVATRLVPYYVEVHDTLVDSVWVRIPIEQHHLAIPDTADIWYSGFSAGIDSLRFYCPTSYVTRKVVETEWRTPRMTLCVGAGALYHEKRVFPYLYLLGEVRYNAKKTTWGAHGAIDNEGRWGVGLGVSYRINLIN